MHISIIRKLVLESIKMLFFSVIFKNFRDYAAEPPIIIMTSAFLMRYTIPPKANCQRNCSQYKSGLIKLSFCLRIESNLHP